MSIQNINNTIMQPQNIVINQMPLPHAIMTNVSANNGIPIATAITHAHAHAPTAVDPAGEIKTGIVVETIPIANANIVGVQTVPIQGANPLKPAQSSSNSEEMLQILTKTCLNDLVQDTDPNLNLEDEVKELLLNYVDGFVAVVLDGASLIAKHRHVNVIEVKDVQQFLNRNYNMWVPGFGTDELRPYKRSLTTESHKQRLALIRKALKKY